VTERVLGSYDVVVVGVGAMGSAATYHLARRGQRVLALEQFDVPHEYGSSHGYTRIIRLPYYEDPAYVPLLRRAYGLWRELQAAAGEPLLHITGSIDAGPAESWVFKGALRSAEQFDLPHEVLDSAELTRRWPGYRLPAETLALYQPEGGFLLPERCIVAHVNGALAHGARVQARERVWSVEAAAGGVRVVTERGAYEAGSAVVAAGAWIGRLVPALADLAVPERQVLAWLQPERPEWFAPERFPVFNLEVPEGRFYGFPVFAVPGFKFGKYHHLGETGDPDTLLRPATPADEALLRDFAARYFPAGAGPTLSLRACMFTNTPDEHFILDRHRTYPALVLASPCSGHGYKFASVIGEILADLATRGATDHDIGLFALTRFGPPA